jgi:predicted AlkP superfamily pyrophosphatase or phosphodiesterase
MKQLFSLALVIAMSFQWMSAQQTTLQPRLIVGITVDQMRYDYLYKYYERYGSGGFRRLLGKGFSCENTHYDYAPTYTGPGHASIYTGTTPSVHGIIGNDWYDRATKQNRYVTSDESVKGVGTERSTGQHSPAVLLSSTITDELRLSNAMQSKVVGVCIKDRGGILPAGHIPNACFWFDDATGNWISSSYYPDSTELPKWVTKFNNKKLALKYISEPWNTLEPEATYTASFPDWDKYEKRFSGDSTGAFPHVLPALVTKGGPGMVRSTPFGNTLTTDFAMTVVEEMELGKDAYPDFLCLSYSSTDYVGHQFGVHSKEVEDTYLRLDLELSRLLDFLDEKFGHENVLVFLTADHGAGETVAHLKDIRIPTGILDENKLATSLNTHLQEVFGVRLPYVEAVINQQVYVNEPVLPLAKLEPETVRKAIAAYLKKQAGVYGALTREELFLVAPEYPFISLLRKGFHQRRSGDVVYILDPAWLPEPYFAQGGTTHGSPYAYDTHVPLVWFGWKIPHGETFEPVYISDIAPTLAALLRIMEPNGATGKPIVPLLEKR